MPGGIATLVGEKNSRNCSKNPPKFPPQSTSRRLFTGRLAARGAAKKNRKFSPKPEPNEFLVKGTSLRSTILTGRSIRNCFRFDQKLFGISRAGAWKSGTACAGTGIASSRRESPGFLVLVGRMLEPGTVVPLFTVDAALLN